MLNYYFQYEFEAIRINPDKYNVIIIIINTKGPELPKLNNPNYLSTTVAPKPELIVQSQSPEIYYLKLIR